MDTNDKELLLDAVNTLIFEDDAPALYQSLLATAEFAMRHPVKLAGRAAALNALLKMRMEDAAAFWRVVGLVDAKREARGMLPLAKPAEPVVVDKTAYQKEFMAQKRERQRRAAELENLARPKTAQLRGNARLEFMNAQSAKWKQQRDAFIERARVAAGGRLSQETLALAISQFWAGVDAELDEKARQLGRAL